MAGEPEITRGPLHWLDRVPLLALIAAALVLGLAPLVPEPHLWQKLRMLAAGTLAKPIDLFDLLWHGWAPLLLGVRLWRSVNARSRNIAVSARPRTLLLPPLPFVAAVLAGWWLDRRVAALELPGGTALQTLGVVLLACAAALMGWAAWTLHRHRTTINPFRGASSLCTDGPFAWSRNPIYVADWLLLVGASFWLRTTWPLLFAPLIWAVIRYGVVGHEETHLEERFGDTYRDYRRRVRRWL